MKYIKNIVILLLILLIGGLNIFISFADENKYGTVTASELNIRSGPSISDDVIKELQYGTEVEIISASDYWYNIKMGDIMGWAYKKYIKEKNISVKARVVASKVNLRSDSTLDAKIITMINKGEVADVLNVVENWVNVKLENGNSGWVYKTLVSIEDGIVSRGETNENVTLNEENKDLRIKIVEFAKNLQGVKYVYGGTTPKGFDCSGFVKYVYNNFDIKINRVAADQAVQGTSVKKSNLLPGDLVFFDTNGGHNYINHVGIYIGGGNFIHASSGSKAHKVVISELDSSFYKDSYMTGRRFID